MKYKMLKEIPSYLLYLLYFSNVENCFYFLLKEFYTYITIDC